MAKQPFSELKRGLIPYLEQGHEVTVSELGYAFKGGSAKITAHLTDLVDRGILQRRKDGRTYVYFLAMSRRSNPSGKYHEVTATSTGRYNGGAATKRQYGSSTVTIFTIDDPTAPGGQRYHKYEGRGATPGERRTAALQAHAARFGITKPVKHVSGKKAREMRIAASTDRPDVGSAPEGYHQIAEAEGPRNVKTVYRKGLYFVHAGTNRGNNKASYTLTHGPTGMAIGVFSTKVNASAAARHFDNVARDAGRSARFGSRPSDSAFDTLRDAFKSLPSKLLK